MERDNPALYREIQAVIAASFKNEATRRRIGQSAPAISTSYESSILKCRTRCCGCEARDNPARKKKKADAAKKVKDSDDVVCLEISEATECFSLICEFSDKSEERNKTSGEQLEGTLKLLTNAAGQKTKSGINTSMKGFKKGISPMLAHIYPRSLVVPMCEN